MYSIAAFYKFVPLSDERVGEIRVALEGEAERHGVLGLLLLGPEGCNGTVASSPEGLTLFIDAVRRLPEFGDVECKYSSSEKRPFRRFKIDRRVELITLKQGNEIARRETYLSPQDWHAFLASAEEPPLVLDVRNDYETALGVFKGARTLPIEKFSELPEAVRVAEIPRDRPILTYCTGGIRCEKAVRELERQGFSRVYQLHGGILKYLEEFPEGFFEGECFVFDHRVAVDRYLRPSTRYSLCPHCGNPAEGRLSCGECGASVGVCASCCEVPDRRSCSKNCAYHLRRRGVRGTESRP